MTHIDLLAHDPIPRLLGAGAWFAVGVLVGAFHFLTLRCNVYLLVIDRRLFLALPAQLARFAALAGALGMVAADFGALALIAATAGILAARMAILRCGAQRMIRSPLANETLFTIGPVPITEPVAVTWGLMAALALGGFLATRSLALAPSRMQTVLEVIVGAIEDQIRDTMRTAPAPYLPLLGTLFLFILIANWSSLIPGIDPPTAHLETDAALALIVFLAVIWFGIRARGVGGYLKTFAQPTIIMLPLNIVETFTRTFSLIVRLFGNIMSGVFIIGIILSLAGLLVPIPLMALDLLTGAVQAYIFTVLAMVFIGGAVSEGREDSSVENETS